MSDMCVFFIFVLFVLLFSVFAFLSFFLSCFISFIIYFFVCLFSCIVLVCCCCFFVGWLLFFCWFGLAWFRLVWLGLVVCLFVGLDPTPQRGCLLTGDTGRRTSDPFRQTPPEICKPPVPKTYHMTC